MDKGALLSWQSLGLRGDHIYRGGHSITHGSTSESWFGLQATHCPGETVAAILLSYKAWLEFLRRDWYSNLTGSIGNLWRNSWTSNSTESDGNKTSFIDY